MKENNENDTGRIGKAGAGENVDSMEEKAVVDKKKRRQGTDCACCFMSSVREGRAYVLGKGGSWGKGRHWLVEKICGSDG